MKGLYTIIAAAVIGLIALPVVGGASAETRVAPNSQQQVQLSYAPIVKKTAPAVVNIFTKRMVKTQAIPFFQDPFFQRFFGNNGGFGVPRDRVERSLGSGVIVSKDGIVVTNNHVVGEGAEILVVLSDKREYEAKLLLADERTDLAILKIDANGRELPAITFEDSDALEVGDMVLAIGNPFGVGQTVTSGIVSAIARTNVGISDYQFFIQTDAAINPGNSGGALVDMNGNLIGINTAIYSRSGGSIGIGFAIPANTVRMVVETAEAGGKLVRPWLGVNLQEISTDIADSLGLDLPNGAVVLDGNPLSPALKAGITTGDVIVEINGKAVDSPAAAAYRFSMLKLGETAKVTYMRDGQRETVDVAAIAAPETPARESTTLEGRTPFAGMVIANLSPALGEELGFKRVRNGVIVTELQGGPAARVGFRPGDILLEVNGQKIETVKDAVAATSKKARSWDVSVDRDGRVISSRFGG